MRWGKVVLIFQAVVTIVIASSFLSQLNLLDNQEIQELKIEFINNGEEGVETKVIDLKDRYKKAAYILSFTGFLELIIISRLLS